MSTPTAHLSTTVTVYWTDRNHERDCEVEVDYTYDGETLTIKKSLALGDTDSCDDDWYDEQIWEGVGEIADEAYAEWLAEYGEYLRDADNDRKDTA